jgi:hypothetical protein
MNKCFKGIIHLEGAGGFVGKSLMDWKVHRLWVVATLCHSWGLV